MTLHFYAGIHLFYSINKVTMYSLLIYIYIFIKIKYKYNSKLINLINIL